MQQNLDFYYTAISQTLPYAYNIRMPAVRGAKNNVFFAQAPHNERYTFKFNGRDSAIRNSQISHALIAAGIPVPQTRAYQFNGEWFEVYPTLHGDTLHECIGRGMTKAEIQSIYNQALNYFFKISTVNFSNIDFGPLKYAHQTARNDTTATNGALIGCLTGTIVRLMNNDETANHGLYHYGMTPKNILVSEGGGKISGILDVDEIGICNPNYAFGVMVAKAKLIGMDTDALCDEYEHITQQKINRRRVSNVVKIQNLGRSILYKTKSR